MVLLEREEQLVVLEGALARARHGSGHSAFIGGEAGIGKTSLVEAFTDSQDGSVRVLWGACEALATPRPLGPLYDIAHELGGRLLQALDADRPPHRLFQVFIDELRSADGVTVVVIEDAHWADDASADFLKFVARRIARYPALLLATFREEEVSAGHPLQRALADVPVDHLTRIRVPGLSATGIARLASAHGRHIPNLHAITGGNPFLATELLRGHEDELLSSLRDAMLARLARLNPGARELAELVAVVPDRAERALLDRTMGEYTADLQQCLGQRMLMADPSHVRYRHELARRIVEDALPEDRRRMLHAHVLAGLAAPSAGSIALPRMVHHADAAGDSAAVLRYAPPAGEEAARHGAHRQSVAFFRTALSHAASASLRERARLLERLASECALSGEGDPALDANARAYDIWCELGDTFSQGTNRRARFEMLHINLFRRGEPEFPGLAGAAVRLLEPHGASGELAKACMDVSFVESMEGRLEQAQAWHDRALATARAAGDPAVLRYMQLQGEFRKHAFFGEPDSGPAESALALALEQGDDQRAAHAYFLLSMFAINSWRLDAIDRVVASGLRFAEERDLDGSRLQLIGMRARAQQLSGDWGAAREAAEEVLAHENVPGIAEFSACLVLGVGHARAGDPRGRRYLERAWRHSTEKIVTRISSVNVLFRLAELNWLEGRMAQACEFARQAEQESQLMPGYPWIRGTAAFWLWRTAGTSSITGGLAPPYAMQLSGDWAGAAAAWAEIGCPYERALALVDGDSDAQREAFAILGRLGATATIRRSRELLAERGVTRIPRGPRPSTRGNPLGLTDREIEILTLLAQGLHNVDISERLHRSGKTVAHHVSAILGKLGADSRHEAVQIAREKGLLGTAR